VDCTTVHLGGHNPSCFSTATGADLLLANGAKFIGSAQLIHGGAILQHGSIDGARCRAVCSVFGAQSFNPIQLPIAQGEALIQSVTEALIAAAVVVLVSRWQCNPFASLRVGGNI